MHAVPILETDGKMLRVHAGWVGSLPVVHVELPTFGIRAGPREEIYFDPSKVTAAIVVVGEHAHSVGLLPSFVRHKRRFCA